MCSPSGGGNKSSGGGGGSRPKKKAAPKPAPKKPSVIKTKSGAVKTKAGVVNKAAQPKTVKPKVVAKGGKKMAEQKVASKKHTTVTTDKAPAAKITKVAPSKPKPKAAIPPLIAKPKATVKPVPKKDPIKKAVEIVKPKAQPKPQVKAPLKPKPTPKKVAPKVTPKGGKSMAVQKEASKKATTAVTKSNAAKGAEKKGRALPKGGKPMAKQKHETKVSNNFRAPVAKAKKEAAKYKEVADKQKSIKHPILGPIVKDKYRNEEKSYNQAYWASRKAGGATQAEMAAEQKEIGMKKAYSGDRVVTKTDQLAAQYKLKGIGEEAYKRDVKPTVKTSKKGLLGETTVTESTYDFGEGGGKYNVTQEKTSPVLGGIRFGEDELKTYVDGVYAANKKGDNPATMPKAGARGDRVDLNKTETTTAPEPTSAKSPNQATASRGPAGPTVQPDNLQNMLAIKKHKSRAGKRSLKNKGGKGKGISFGAGGVGLSIPT